MKRSLLAFLLLAGVAEAGLVTGKLRTGTAYPSDVIFAINEGIRDDLTFFAPLKENCLAWGRGSTAPTYTNATATNRSYLNPTTGLIAYVGPGVPRFEANGYLSEGSRVNSLTYSNSPNGSGWVKGQVTVTPFSDTSPDGTITSTLVGAVANSGSLYFPTALATGAAYASSVYIKRKTGTGLIYLTANAGTATGWTAVTVTTAYTRVSDVDTTASPAWGLQFQTANDEVYISLMQLEAGTFASSYIPTTTGAVQRVADSLIYPVNKNFYLSSGTVRAKVTSESWPNAYPKQIFTGATAGDAGEVMYQGYSTGPYSYDGTTNVSGLVATQSGTMDYAVAWSSAGRVLFANRNASPLRTFNGNWNNKVNSMGIGTASPGGGDPNADANISGMMVFSNPLTAWELGFIR